MADGEAQARACGRGHLGQSPVEPAVPGAEGRVRAVLEDVLAVEVGALAIAGGRRRDDGEPPVAIHRVQRLERRVEAEIAVEVDGALGARWRHREMGPSLAVVPVGIGRYRVQRVQAAAQDDDHEPLVGGRAGEGGAHRQQRAVERRAAHTAKHPAPRNHRHLL